MPPSDEDLVNTREQLVALLRMSPTLVQVVETDPSLLADQDYVTRNNPQLAQFLTAHPEIARNPDFYLFANLPQPRGRRVDSLARRIANRDTRSDDAEARRRFLLNVLQIPMFIAVIVCLMWLIRMLFENRRWTRLFRMQTEVHGKLIDRFGNNQELLQYMETEPGKRFLEAAPIPVDFERSQRLPGGLSRILAPLQFGVVLVLLGIGLLFLKRELPEAAGPLLVFGVAALMPGLGFIISAIITWRISARLGLLPQPGATFPQSTDRQ